MCTFCDAHIPGKDTDSGMGMVKVDRPERHMVIELENLKNEIRALEQEGMLARSMQIRVVGPAEALPEFEEKTDAAMPSPAEPCYIDQLRYLIFQLKGAREHIGASIQHLDTAV